MASQALLPNPGSHAPDARPDAAELDHLAAAFGSLAHPTRVGLLDVLREPQTVRALTRAFHVSRPALLKHLAVLQSAGLVGRVQRRRPPQQFVADPAAVFALKERFAPLAAFPPHPEVAQAATAPARAMAAARIREHGLLLVHGVAPGRWFSLEGRGEATLGRGGSCTFEVPNDPFVSQLHARLDDDGGAWAIEDLGSRNGTWIDFAPCPPGERAILSPGAVVTVGRTTFAFR